MTRFVLLCLILAISLTCHRACHAIDFNTLPAGTEISFTEDIEVPAFRDAILLFERERESSGGVTHRLTCTLSFDQSNSSRILRRGVSFVVVGGGWGFYKGDGATDYDVAVLDLQKKDSSGPKIHLSVRDNGDDDRDDEQDFEVDVWARRCGFIYKMREASDF